MWCSLWGTDWILKCYLDETSQLDQGFPWFSSVLRANAELVPKFHCTACLSCSPPNSNIKISPSVTSLIQKKIKISPYTALPRFNLWFRGSNWMQWNPAQLISLLRLSPIPSSQPNVLLPLQPTFTKRTSGHCLGTFTAVYLALTLPF
jgi:hypothetical protein